MRQGDAGGGGRGRMRQGDIGGGGGRMRQGDVGGGGEEE